MGVGGQVGAGFEPVKELFEDSIGRSPGSGAAFALWRGGEWLVDLWGGFADADRTRPWTADTIVMPYSVTKPFAALCVLVLVDRGQVSLDDPMARFWPALTGGATVRHVLAHSAGFVVLDDPATPDDLMDPERLRGLIEAQPPSWEPGTAVGESALLYGSLLGEVVRAVDGRTLGTFLREEICLPHGIDFHIGVPDEALARVADLTGVGPQLVDPAQYTDALMPQALANPPGALDPLVVNSRPWRQAEVAAVNGHGSARAVADLYALLARGELLSAGTLAELTRVQAEGVDRVTGGYRAWGLGVSVDGTDGWGMGGLGGSLGWWSEVGEYAVGFVSGNLPAAELGSALENAARSVLGLPAV